MESRWTSIYSNSESRLISSTSLRQTLSDCLEEITNKQLTDELFYHCSFPQITSSKQVCLVEVRFSIFNLSLPPLRVWCHFERI